MSKMIFVNLPVTDLPRAVGFYEAIGPLGTRSLATTQRRARFFPTSSTSCC